MPSVTTFFRHCPSCGRRFEIRLVRKEEVDSESHEEEMPKSSVGPAVASAGLIPRAVLVQQEKPTIVDVDEFEYTYRCKHCGHVWTEVRAQDNVSKLPRVTLATEPS